MKLKFRITRGDTFEETLQFTEDAMPVDISDWDIEAQIRRSVNSGQVAAFTVTKLEPQEDGIVTLSLTADETAVLQGSYVWDVERKLEDVITTLVSGTLLVRADVTRRVEVP